MQTYHSGQITRLYFRKSNRFAGVWQQVKAIGQVCQTLRARQVAGERLH